LSDSNSNPLIVGLYRRFVEKRRRVFKASVGNDLIEVVSIRGELFLLHNGVTQSREKAFAEGYWKFWSLLPSLFSKPEILVVGLGGGTVCRIIESLYDDYHIDAVEISGLIISLAEKFFGLKASDRVALYNEDALEFVKRTTKRYDLVILDVYSGIQMPPHLYSKAFFDSLAERMKEGAILSINLAPAMRTHLGEIFGNLASFASKFFVVTPGNNVIAFCSEEKIGAGELIEAMKNGSHMIKDNHESSSLVDYFESGLVSVGVPSTERAK
jgi:spermidine synthase